MLCICWLLRFCDLLRQCSDKFWRWQKASPAIILYGSAKSWSTMPEKSILEWVLNKDFFWSTRPTTVPGSSDHYFHTECLYIRPSVPKLQISCRPGLWNGRVDHWWLLSCYILVLMIHSIVPKITKGSLNCN